MLMRAATNPNLSRFDLLLVPVLLETAPMGQPRDWRLRRC